MSAIPISDAEFARFQRFIRQAAGIDLQPGKKQLVSGRLTGRLRHHGLASFGDYFRLISGGAAPDETQTAVDLLTTNETYFFREPRHFEFLRKLIAANPAGTKRIWSAASSSGEEAYSAAMVLADTQRGGGWQVVGSDVSDRILKRAASGIYPLQRARHIPSGYLRRFCLKGTGSRDGTLLIERGLRRHVRFIKVNLNEPLPGIGSFDLIFLRNVMIYFDADTKRQVVARVLGQLRSGGHLLIGHSENLHGISGAVRAVAPSIYLKP